MNNDSLKNIKHSLYESQNVIQFCLSMTIVLFAYASIILLLVCAIAKVFTDLITILVVLFILVFSFSIYFIVFFYATLFVIKRFKIVSIKIYKDIVEIDGKTYIYKRPITINKQIHKSAKISWPISRICIRYEMNNRTKKKYVYTFEPVQLKYILNFRYVFNILNIKSTSEIVEILKKIDLTIAST